jgi:pimeloyl-ACP methyl ester carboxylesterase
MANMRAAATRVSMQSPTLPCALQAIARMACVFAMLATGACASTGASQLPRLAAGHRVHATVVRGLAFRHRLISNEAAAANDGRLLVFIEGDGRPWTSDGSSPSRDPTARKPLAFELFLGTRQPAWYLTRPCYEQLRDTACSAAMWTSDRYSSAVVDSMAAALLAALGPADRRELVLVGYSGGGVIATLLAPRLPRVGGVVAIAANLDVAAWAQLHGYEPLAGSLDPAREPAPAVPRVLLAGARDTNVPPSSIAGYLVAHPGATVLQQASFDHVCCWVRDWDPLLRQALALLPAGAVSRN